MDHPALNRLRTIYRNEGILGAIRAIFRFLTSIVENIYVHMRAWMNYLRLRSKYGRAAPGPYHTINIDPNQIDLILFGFSFSKERTYVRGGGWDQNISTDDIGLYGFEHEITSPTLYRYDQYILAQSLQVHFANGVAWEETRFYEYLIENKTKVEDKSGNYSDVEKRLSQIDDLYDEISKNGYQSQEELSLMSIPLISSPPNTKEIKVAIGRDGEILLVDGRHRFVIARILDFESIPVKVVLRHAKWMEFRNELHSAGQCAEDESKTELKNHPDLVDISEYGD